MLHTTRRIILPPPTQPAPVHGSGIVKGNPTRCLVCRSEIQAGDQWVKHTSPAEPKHGAYSIIIHANCNKQN